MSDQVSVGTFNLYNLQTADTKVYGRPLYTSGPKGSYQKKIRWVGQQLRKLKANIVGFQEVWSPDALIDVAQESGCFGKKQLYVSKSGPHTPAVALASTFRVLETQIIEAFPKGLDFSTQGATVAMDSFSRPVLRAEILLPQGIRTIVYVAHLKSKRPRIHDGEDRHDPRTQVLGTARSLLVRTAEAAALRWLVINDMEHSRTPVIVIGDLNDGVDSVTTQMITGEPSRSKRGALKRAAWDVLLYSTYELQAQQSHRDVFYSHVHNHRFETLDHILVSEELAGKGPSSIGQFVRMDVWNDHLNVRPKKFASDHAQVVARFRLHASGKIPDARMKSASHPAKPIKK